MRSANAIRKLLPVLAALGLIAWTPAQAESSRLEEVLDRIVENERNLVVALEDYRPVVETYLQTVEPDASIGSKPVKDNYFLGRLELGPDPDTLPADEDSKKAKKRRDKKNKKALSLFEDFHSQTFKPQSFTRMLVIDRGAFNHENYRFQFVRTEFLGEVRTLVFDVIPRDGKPLKRLRTSRFVGRIWVEDEGYHIVRFNGIYEAAMAVEFHFDSWRMNLAPGLWLPAYVYTEETDRTVRQIKYMHRGQTRIWGYEIARPDVEDEFTKVLIDAPRTKDESDSPGAVSPIESARAWKREAEDNVVRRLEDAGLLAPEGEVDEVLETVVTNLEITNDLDIQPRIRCRVLLTTPLESFTVGHTIVISRGLLDVLPDEASLAMVLAREMGYILTGQKLDTRFAFTDRILVEDRETFRQFSFEGTPEEHAAADARAYQLLQSSPYKDGLQAAGLFLEALELRAGKLNALVEPHFGRAIVGHGDWAPMTPLREAAPELRPESVDQVAALPLGGRIKLDPWNARVELMKNDNVALVSAHEKMPFQITPVMPYLARFGSQDGTTDSAQGGADDDNRTAAVRK